MHKLTTNKQAKRSRMRERRHKELHPLIVTKNTLTRTISINGFTIPAGMKGEFYKIDCCICKSSRINKQRKDKK